MEQQNKQPIPKLHNISIIIIISLITALITVVCVFVWQKIDAKKIERNLHKQIISLQSQIKSIKEVNLTLNESLRTISKSESQNYSNPNEIITQPATLKHESDWKTFKTKKTEEIQFIFEYPGNWKFNDSSIFHNELDNKVAEFSPGVILLNNDQKCFNSPHNDYSGRIKLISQENFIIENNSGVKKITETKTEKGVWYPNSYCLQKENKAFNITFYEINLNSEKRQVFDKIISSFKFIE